MFGTEIRIDETTVKSAIEKKLPYEGTVLGSQYTVGDVTVAFGEDGRFDLLASVAVNAKGRTAMANVDLSSGLDYKRESGSFYLQEVSIDGIEWLKVEPKESDKSLFGKAVNGLKNLGITEATMANVMASFEAPLKQSLKSMSESTLASVRVYELGDGMKGALIARALSDVTVQKGELVVSLSWADLFTRVVIYLVVGLVTLVAGGLMFTRALRGGKGGNMAFDVAMEGAGALGGAFLD
jgi:hypothetical protein